jgi:hypothetical protein
MAMIQRSAGAGAGERFATHAITPHRPVRRSYSGLE